MVKKAALSVRISDSTKKALDKEAAKERRSTAALVDVILGDWLQSQLAGAPRKYLTPDEQLAAGGKLMDMLLPTGKALGKSTGAELEALGEAYVAFGEKIKAHAGRGATLKKRSTAARPKGKGGMV